MISYAKQGCYISREICLFLGRREILRNTGKYGKIWEIQNFKYGLSVGSVAGMLTCWKLIKLGTKKHIISRRSTIQAIKTVLFTAPIQVIFS